MRVQHECYVEVVEALRYCLLRTQYCINDRGTNELCDERVINSLKMRSRYPFPGSEVDRRYRTGEAFAGKQRLARPDGGRTTDLAFRIGETN